MHTPYGHLSYCTNIHPGEDWAAHFEQLQLHVPQIKKSLSPHAPFGIGLRLAAKAAQDLQDDALFQNFKTWLQEKDCYVFTINGFPYGGFHNTVVKADVHTPDWTTAERVQYTIQLAHILAKLLPEGEEGSISTSPLSYRYWHEEKGHNSVFEKGTEGLLEVVKALVQLKSKTGTVIHIDIEPEPDGMMETGPEFIHWFNHFLLPLGIKYLQEETGCSASEADASLRTHVRLCYDICHFAIGFEDHLSVLARLEKEAIKVGKIQISAALKASLPNDKIQSEKIFNAFAPFNEPVYLHQVIAQQRDKSLKRYRDLPQAFDDAANNDATEWRAHFHVPLFIADYGLLQSTQSDIEQVLAYHKKAPFANHLEVETYTWDVLPDNLKLPVDASIIRELQWVQQTLSL